MKKKIGLPLGSSGCSESYARFGLIEIARCRFQAFEMKFHRKPEPHEPLFFSEFNGHPVKADLATTRLQLVEAARACKIRIEPVLNFLGLPPLAAGESGAVPRGSREAKSHRTRPLPSASRRTGSGKSRIWERFLTDDRLHHLHSISGQELKMLTQVSFLGQAQTVEDCLLVLKTIRKAGE